MNMFETLLTPMLPLIACSRIEVFPHFLAPHTTTFEVFPIARPTHLVAPGMYGMIVQWKILILSNLSQIYIQLQQSNEQSSKSI